jgi:hypothetical protein
MTKEMEAAKSNINFKRRLWKASLGFLRVINDGQRMKLNRNVKILLSEI